MSIDSGPSDVNVLRPQTAAYSRQTSGKTTANQRPHLSRVAGTFLLMLTAIAALYLGAHVVAAVAGWQAAAFALVVIAWALFVSGVLAAAARGGRR